MELDSSKIIQAVWDGVRDGVKNKLSGYGTPLDKLLSDILTENAEKFRVLIGDAISTAVDDKSFREEIKSAVRSNLARLLVARFGGELEKQVNALKSDPATRARITLAIEQLVAGSK